MLSTETLLQATDVERVAAPAEGEKAAGGKCETAGGLWDDGGHQWEARSLQREFGNEGGANWRVEWRHIQKHLNFYKQDQEIKALSSAL